MQHWTLKHIALILFLVSISFAGVGQTKASLEKKRDQLLRDIKFTNKLIAESKENQGEASEQLEALTNQIALRKKLIRTIDREAVTLQKDLNRNKEQIAQLEAELVELKGEYASLIYLSYKNQSSEDKLLYIFASDNLSQAWMRLSHLKALTEYQQRQGEQIVESKAVVEAKNVEIKAQKKEKLVLLDEQKSAKSQLDKDMSKANAMLENLQKDEQDLKKKLKEQREKRRKLNKEIERLIIKDMKGSENKAGKFTLTPEETLVSKSFSKNRGKLPWPVEKGVIIGRFGTHPHPVIKGVEVTNNGIDIATEKNADVRAIFSGEVSGIIDIPGTGMAVIVKHGGYRTVYTNLKEVFVEKGQMLDVKDAVGELLPDGTRSIAHLEIWQITTDGMKKSDPEVWIAR